MDIQKENEQIQEAFEIEADEIGFCLDKKWGDYENPYENSDTALAFDLFKKGWQTKVQSVPEGFVLVKMDDLELLRDSALEIKYASLNNDSDRIFSDIEDIQLSIERLIGEQEQGQ